MSTRKYALILLAISLNFWKSIILEYADPPAIINFGLYSIDNFSTSSKSIRESSFLTPY